MSINRSVLDSDECILLQFRKKLIDSKCKTFFKNVEISGPREISTAPHTFLEGQI